jgi:WD40 repeat protein
MPDFTSAKLTNHLTFEGNWPSTVAFIDNTRLVAGNLDGKLFLWDLAQPAVELSEEEQKQSEIKDRQPNIHPLRRLDGHTNGITRLFTAEGGKLLVSASMDHTIRLWDTSAPSAGETEAVLDADQRRRKIKRDKSNEQEVLSQPGIKVQTQTFAHVLEGHQDWINGCSLSANGQRLVTGDDSGVTIVWDFPARKEIKRWQGHKQDGVVSTAVSPDGKKCFVCEHRMRRGDYDRPPAQAKIFSLDDGAMLLDLLVIKFSDVKEEDRVNSYGYAEKWGKWVGHGFVAAAFSPDGKILAVAQGGERGDSQAHLIDAETGKEIRSVSKHEYGLCDVVFTPDGKYLFTAGRDTCAKVIQVEDGKEVATLGKPRGGQFKDWFHAIAISPDQSRIAAADIAGMIHVWQIS